MDELRRGVILADCIERLLAGETASDCLAQYGDEAAAVLPLLTAAARLHRVNTYCLTAYQRGQAKATLRAAMLSHNRRTTHSGRTGPWYLRPALTGSVRGLALAGMLALTLIAVVTVTAVAASQPGDVGYPVRVVVERAPVLLKSTAAARAAAELRIADRRLLDLETRLKAGGELVPAAVEALLAGDQAVAGRATELSRAERFQAASHVAAQAATLATLAQSTRQMSARVTLEAVAAQVESLAQRLMSDDVSGGVGSSLTPGPVETPAQSGNQIAPIALTATRTPAAPVGHTGTPLPASVQPTPIREMPTAQPPGLGQRATALAKTATASPGIAATPVPSGPPASLGTPGGLLTGSPIPGRRATALSQTATAPAPRATHTAEPAPTQVPIAEPDTPVPGHRATALAQTGTAPAPAATDAPVHQPEPTSARMPDTPAPERQETPPAQPSSAPVQAATGTPKPPPALTPDRGPDTPVPGRRATARAELATPAGAGVVDDPDPSTDQAPFTPAP